MNTVGLVLHQARFDLLGFVRNRQARFFTLVLPILFLVIFVSVFGNDKIGPEHVKASTYYVPGLSRRSASSPGRSSTSSSRSRRSARPGSSSGAAPRPSLPGC